MQSLKRRKQGFLALKIGKTWDGKWSFMFRFVYLCKLLTLGGNLGNLTEAAFTLIIYFVMRNVLRAHLEAYLYVNVGL